MARKFIKRVLPDPEWFKTQNSIQMLGNWAHEPNLWHLNRYSVSTAVFIGLFVAFMPIPTQMLLAGLCAIVFRANLPISVILVWVTNPITIAPIFYLAYGVGSAVIGAPGDEFVFKLSWEFLGQLAEFWQPFLLGCFLCGLFFGLLGSTAARLLWRWHVIKRWRERRAKRQQSSPGISE
jgi:uncharacterized protein (DUF2062 family)